MSGIPWGYPKKSLDGLFMIISGKSPSKMNDFGVIAFMETPMWIKQCHKAAVTGNGQHTATIPPIKMLMTGGWFMLVLPTKNRVLTSNK